MIYDVIALGELLIDFSPVGTDDGGYPILAAKPGGAPANYLAALSTYGMKTAFLCKVGNDAFGRMLLATLVAVGIETKGILLDDAAFTTLAFVTLDGAGERSFSFSRKPGADTRLRFEELDLSMIDAAKVFHFGTLSLTDEPARRATQEAVAYATERNKLITFDPNLRLPLWKSREEAEDQILWGLRCADIVKISNEEIEFLWDCSEKDGAARLIGEFGVSLVMVTLGANGCYLANDRNFVAVPCPPVKPVDTTGAGDIFGGAALSRILSLGKNACDLNLQELREIAEFASVAASLSTQKPGGISSIPEEEAVVHMVKRIFG